MEKPVFGLGIDMGGTQTRWALADGNDHIIVEGSLAGATALHVGDVDGTNALQAIFLGIAKEIGASCEGAIAIGSVQAGLTGLTEIEADINKLRQLLADTFHIQPQAVRLSNDVENAYLNTFKLGQGYLVYAGTGSIAAYIDESGRFHRIGGHGYILDDAGSGYWIAREALRHIWRREDEQVGAWRTSPMAVSVFAAIGGSNWDQSRAFIYQGSRGDVGKLALAVAASADQDVVAMAILQSAGLELARLAQLLCQRFGEKPVVLSGRVRELHPIIASTMAHHLPDNCIFQLCNGVSHHGAAKMAAQRLRESFAKV